MAAAKFSPALFLEAVLVGREEFTEGVARFRFALNGELTFHPGQYATLARVHGDDLVQRPYSICSPPGGRELEFYCDLVPGGELTPILWEMPVGDRLLVRRRTAGRFLLAETPGFTRHLFAATVTGAAPFLSMIRHHQAMLARGEDVPRRDFLLVHGASRYAELAAIGDELAALGERVDWFHYVPTVSRRRPGDGWRGESGRVEDVLRKHADAAGFTADAAVGYACGNPGMVSAVRGILARAGFPEDRIREERYYPEEDAGE